MNDRMKIGLSFFVASTVWGSTWLAIRLGLEAMPPVLSAALRFVIAGAILFLLIRYWKLDIPFNANAWKTYLNLAVLTFTIPFALVYWGQQYIPTGLSSILFGAFPFWVALFSHLMLADERLDVPKILAIMFGFAGVVVIFSSEVYLSDERALLGMLTIAFSTAMQAYSLILVKKYGQAISPIVMNFVGIAFGAVALLVLSYFLERGSAVEWNLQSIGSLLYLSIVGTVLAYVVYYWLLKRVDALYLSLTSFINPIVAVVLGAAVLGERLAPKVFVGAGLVFVGILAANVKSILAKWRSA